jgi:putative ABC transport system permease protein
MLVNPVCRYIFIRVGSNNISSTINFIESAWKKELPDRPFSFNFLEETISNQYKSEQQLETIINYFAMFAIFISSLGLFGLVFFMTEKRKKEIGIRKVLGASIPGIIFMLSKDFTKWILTANIIAWPIAYYFMNKWLEDFAYRIEISWWMFALAGGIALVIALATVSIQAIKAAAANPVESLRYE